MIVEECWPIIVAIKHGSDHVKNTKDKNLIFIGKFCRATEIRGETFYVVTCHCRRQRTQCNISRTHVVLDGKVNIEEASPRVDELVSERRWLFDFSKKRQIGTLAPTVINRDKSLETNLNESHWHITVQPWNCHKKISFPTISNTVTAINFYNNHYFVCFRCSIGEKIFLWILV